MGKLHQLVFEQVTDPIIATIGVDNKSIGLGQYDNKLDAAKAYDTYVILNNLEHTINGVLHEPIRLHVETFNSGS